MVRVPDIEIRRVYDATRRDDEYCVLVDRLWPRGVSKADAALDEWAKHAAPSNELRKWFNHESSHWDEFRERYRRELAAKVAALHGLLSRCGDRRLVLLYAARDPECNHARVLAEFLREL